MYVHVILGLLICIEGTPEELLKFGWMIIRSFIMLLCHMQRTQIMESKFANNIVFK